MAAIEANMATIAFYARERWFEFGLKFFAAGALVSLLALGLIWVPQLRVMATIAFVQAALGMLVCAMGLRETRPARWQELRIRVRSAGHRLRQRLRRSHVSEPVLAPEAV
jgi:hypothetical protein